ncbi:protein PET117 homolog, mitochondrial [Meleagris gallopavo]|uniref:protein PET117 homolog, mitochondrial n=1 Tax=Meleagris gallopavo TaxID=9103 RepID=UPI00093AB718|nr:protein PET117 homolog, mitochondrial [Meleagris gallopavo]
MAVGGLQSQYGTMSSPARWTGAQVGWVTLAIKQAVKPCPLCFQRLHSGVLRDLERQNLKRENIRLLEEQIALTKRLTEEREKMLAEKGSQQS